MSIFKPQILLLIFCIALSGCSHGALGLGDDACSALRRTDPSAAALACGGSSGGSSKIAAPRTSIGTRTLMNPAFIPTGKSDLGVETMVHYLNRDDGTKVSPNFSLIKGFGRAGAGITTNTSNTFYGNDIMQRAYRRPRIDNFHEGEDPKRPSVPSLNAGTSISVLPNTSFLSAVVGASLKYNNTTDTFGPSVGVGMGMGRISVSVNGSKEKVSNDQSSTMFATMGVGLQLPYLQFDYNYMKNWNTFDLKPIHILTATLSIQHLIVYGAVRHLNYLKNTYGDAIETYQYHGGAQYLFHRKFSLGWSINYIPGSSALIGQFFL